MWEVTVGRISCVWRRHWHAVHTLSFFFSKSRRKNMVSNETTLKGENVIAALKFILQAIAWFVALAIAHGLLEKAWRTLKSSTLWKLKKA